MKFSISAFKNGRCNENFKLSSMASVIAGNPNIVNKNKNREKRTSQMGIIDLFTLNWRINNNVRKTTKIINHLPTSLGNMTL